MATSCALVIRFQLAVLGVPGLPSEFSSGVVVRLICP